MTVRELIAEIRKPGRVMLPVLLPEDVIRIEVVKADVLAHLAEYSPGAPAPWYVVRREGGVLELDREN